MENRKWIKPLKKWLRYLKYFLISSVILVFLQIAIGYWLISSRWSIFLTDQQMVSLSSQVNDAQPLPDNFIQLYDKLYPNVIHASMAEQLFVNYGTRILFRRKQIENLPHCFCDLVYGIQVKNSPILAEAHWPGRLQELEYGFAIEKFSSPEKCFDYVINHELKKLSTLPAPEFSALLSKDISSMNEDELGNLIILLRGKDF